MVKRGRRGELRPDPSDFVQIFETFELVDKLYSGVLGLRPWSLPDSALVDHDTNKNIFLTRSENAFVLWRQTIRARILF